MVLIVLCVGVEYLCCLHLICVFIVLVRLMSGRLFGNSCSLGLQYVSVVQVSNCQFSFSHFGFLSATGNFSLIASFLDHCLLVPFFQQQSYCLLLRFFSKRLTRIPIKIV